MSDILTGYTIGPHRQIFWDLRATANFIGGGTGTGLLLLAPPALYAGVPFVILGSVGLALVAGGLLFVWLEIGKPLRALNVFRHPRTSWMSREAWTAPFLIAVGLFAVWTANGGLAIATALLAAIFLYCQARILTAAKGIPAWREPLVLSLILGTGLAEGAGLLLFLAPLVSGIPAWGSPLLLALLGMRAAIWIAYRRALCGNGAPVGTVRALDRANPVFLVLGHALPALLVVLAYLLPIAPGLAEALVAAAGLLALAGGWFVKVILVTRAAYTQGFALSHAPARGPGGAGPGDRPGWA